MQDKVIEWNFPKHIVSIARSADGDSDYIITSVLKTDKAAKDEKNVCKYFFKKQDGTVLYQDESTTVMMIKPIDGFYWYMLGFIKGLDRESAYFLDSRLQWSQRDEVGISTFYEFSKSGKEGYWEAEFDDLLENYKSTMWFEPEEGSRLPKVVVECW